jgi:hypothetical protein
MKALTANQQYLLDCLPVGQTAIVLTSEYAKVYNNKENLPILHCTAPALRGLAARGLITADHYWRGANVTRIA